MKTEQINLRLEQRLVGDLERLAAEESLDRATLMRKLLIEAIGRYRLDRAIRQYQQEETSLGRASQDAGISQWQLLEEIRKRHVAYPLEPDDIETRIDLFRKRIAPQAAPARGFQGLVEWQGKEIRTLLDLKPKPGSILLVGVNPASVSVDAGHYYQGRLGRRLWSRLQRLDLLRNPLPGEEDVAFHKEGHGISDVVKRPTPSSNEISPGELEMGARRLREKIRAWRPGLVLFVFKKAAEAASQTRSIAPGTGPEIEGVTTFLLSGPYAATAEAARIDSELARLIGRVRRTRNGRPHD